MHMPQVFKCAACSAPLEFEGGPMQKCKFCGSSVIVPSELVQNRSTGPFSDVLELKGKAEKVAEIRRLIAGGKKLEAIKMFRETFGTGLKETKDAVDRIERGEGVDISGIRVENPSTVSLKIDGAAARKAGIAIGGTMLAVIIVALIIAGTVVVGAVLILRSETKDFSITGDHPPVPGDIPKTAEAESDVVELMRFGGDGTGAGRFKDNRHVAVDGSGRIYSADYSGGRIQVFDGDGKFVNQWIAEKGMNLYGLAADRNGHLYVLNNKGIRKFEGESGKLINSLDTHVFRELALTLDSKVIAVGRYGISIFAPDLSLISEFKNAASDADATLGFESVTVDGNGVMFLLDRKGKDIFKFSSEGKFLDRIPIPANSPNSIALDPAGKIYISETSSISVLTPEGQLVKKVGAFQAFGITFNNAGEMFVAARPFVIKQRIKL